MKGFTSPSKDDSAPSSAVASYYTVQSSQTLAPMFRVSNLNGIRPTTAVPRIVNRTASTIAWPETVWGSFCETMEEVVLSTLGSLHIRHPFTVMILSVHLEMLNSGPAAAQDLVGAEPRNQWWNFCSANNHRQWLSPERPAGNPKRPCSPCTQLSIKFPAATAGYSSFIL